MCENVASHFDASAALERSKYAIKGARRFSLKRRPMYKQVSKPSGACTTLKDSNAAINSLHGLSPELRPDFEKDCQPSGASALSHVSSSALASARESLSKFSPRLGRDSRASIALTTTKDSGGSEVPLGGYLFKLFSRRQRHQSNVECPLKCPLKPPIIRSRTSPGPSNLAECCRASTVQLVPEQVLDTLSTYWHFRDNFDRLARRSYRQGDEIQCLLRCTKSPPRSIGMYGGLDFAHRALHGELDRLHQCIKKKDADLDEDMVRIVLDEMKTFMERFDSLTADLQLACQALRAIFDEAVMSEGTLECGMPNPRTVFPYQWELRFTWICWDLRRSIQPLTEAISSEGRKRRHVGPKAVIVKPMEE
jgi:hypothetical protein